MTLKHVELFDATRHALKETAVALAFDPKGMIALSDPARPFGAEMRVLLGGENDIGYGETLMLTPDDCSLCVGNAKKRLSESFIPLIYDHGWSARGTEGAGAVVDCFERSGDLWLSVDFADADIFAGACKPGKKWMGRSLGFGAWIDAEQKVRPADPKECSLTNLPRMKGLGPVVGLSAIRRYFDLSRPMPHPAAAPIASPEGTETAPAGGGTASLSTPSRSPDPARNGKEERMFNVPPKLQRLLGRGEFANEDEFNRAVEALDGEVALGEKKPKPCATCSHPAHGDKACGENCGCKKQGEERTPPTAGVTLADVDRIVAEKTEKALATIAEANAKSQVEAAEKAQKKARVDAVLDKGFRLGKILKDDFALLRPSVEANPDAFEARLASMPKVSPVDDSGLEGGGEPTTLGDGEGGYRAQSESLTYAAQYARVRNIGLSEAQAEIAALRAAN